MKNSQEEFDQYFEVDGVQTILKSTITQKTESQSVSSVPARGVKNFHSPNQRPPSAATTVNHYRRCCQTNEGLY
jgi:hypothetical protein